MSDIELPVVGLIPAGGLAARLAPLPCSKELLPVGFYTAAAGPRPKPVCLYLIERMRAAGITRAFVVLRPGKWDIPAYLGDGSEHGLHLAYLTVHIPHGSPYTLDQAYPFVQDHIVVLGLPDIIFEPVDAYARLLAHLRASGAAVALGLFPTDQPHSADMVATDDEGLVRRIEIKPAQTELRYTWMIAAWAPGFSTFMHHYLQDDLARRNDPDPARRPSREVFIGDVLQAAINAGLPVQSLRFPTGNCLDVGTPANIIAATIRYANQV